MANIQVIQYDDITVRVIRPSGSNNYKVGNSGDSIISGPTISGDTCTIVIKERGGRRIKKVYSLPNFGIKMSSVI